MELTRCSNGHFYDSERFTSCPYCSGSQQREFTETVPYTDELTVAGNGAVTEVQKSENASQESLSQVMTGTLIQEMDQDKTIGIFKDMIGTESSTEPVVGWLVCIEGNHFGEDFRLTSGRNFIGRSEDMDIRLTGDNSISRDKHAVILYEPRANVFMIQPGESRELFYVNDKVVLAAEVIKSYDILSLGKTKLMFIPCCGEQFKWDNTKKEDEK